MKKVSEMLYRFSRGWIALVALVIFGLFTALVLPDQARQAEENTGQGTSPDTSFFYSEEELYTVAESYGEAGRAAYIRARLTFDIIWPLVYTFFLLTAISWLFGQVLAPENRLRWVNWFPLFAILFDFLENLSTSLVMFRYPEPTPVVAALAPWFTALKWIFVSGSFVLVILGVIFVLWKRIRD